MVFIKGDDLINRQGRPRGKSNKSKRKLFIEEVEAELLSRREEIKKASLSSLALILLALKDTNGAKGNETKQKEI